MTFYYKRRRDQDISIITSIANDANIPLDKIFDTTNKTAPVVIARHRAILALAALKPSPSSQELASIFHYKDHTSVLYALGRLRRKPGCRARLT